MPAAERILVAQQPLDLHPVAIYLARLAPGSRRIMHAALNLIAGS